MLGLELLRVRRWAGYCIVLAVSPPTFYSLFINGCYVLLEAVAALGVY